MFMFKIFIVKINIENLIPTTKNNKTKREHLFR
jgi:hypothetical protein